MFYEARTHELLPVSDAAAAARVIKTKEAKFYQIPTWEQDGVKIMAVNDCHPDGSSFEETAVIKVMPDGSFYQIESITAAWCTEPELTDYFLKAITAPCSMGKANVIIGKPQGTEMAVFSCGCCGNSFKGNVRQQEFDQDAGFGICPKCEKYS